jgi:2',3'-cyclic-nucleotide 2'-phosphodiesterase
MGKITALMLGDVVGQPGCRALFTCLPGLKKKYKTDIVIVNGENASDGRGMTPEVVDLFFRSGVDVITSGNHIWHNKDIYTLLDKEDRLLRPENYPLGVPGKGHCVIKVKNISIGVINLEGRVFLSNLRCPFIVGLEVVSRIRKETKIIIIDFHAEWPEEKEALGIYLDGEISAIVGTHTHVQTADERILPKGTAYLTDIGMTGPVDSVIGMKTGIVLEKNISQMPLRMEVAETQADIMGVVLDIDTDTGKTLSIQRIWEKSLV